tara:strand:- start:497 stop:823 length:327 start_codon:yes stop_codon:yes gene_type:complete
MKKLSQKQVLNALKKFAKRKNLSVYKDINKSSYSQINPDFLSYEMKECKSELIFKAKLVLNKEKDLSDFETMELCKLLWFLDKSKKNLLEHLELTEQKENKSLGFKES